METSDTSEKKGQDGVAFNIDFGDIRPKSSGPPSRFLEYQQRSQRNKMQSSEEIFQKQRQADERRQDYEKAKLERIKERTEECRKIDEKVHRLGVHTNYYGGYKSENVKPLSSKEKVLSVKSLAKDFSKISTGIKGDAVFAKKLNT